MLPRFIRHSACLGVPVIDKRFTVIDALMVKIRASPTDYCVSTKDAAAAAAGVSVSHHCWFPSSRR